MKALVLSLLLASASTAAASADTFTFSSTNQVTNQVGGPTVGGSQAAAVFSTGASQVTGSSGAKTTNTTACAIWTNEPGARFPTSGVCDYTETTGDKVRLAFTCAPTTKDQTQSNRWGGLDGLAGPHAGKSGTISFHTWGGAGRTTSPSAGAGVWPD